MCWFKGAFLPIAFIIFVSFIRTSITCNLLVNSTEGDSVQLSFPYSCYGLKITLKHGNRLPFYSSADPEFLELNPDQSERFTVENKNEEDRCFLQLGIDPVTRDDGGKYILVFGYYGFDASGVRLHVDFLPGMPNCSFGGIHDHTRGLERLDCIATVGSELGQIQCYQGGMRMPHLNEPSENDNKLNQTILVKQNRHHVYCCSSLLKKPKEICDCNDAVWDPLSQGEVHYPGDPCPTTTHVPTAPLTTSRATKGEIKEENYPINKLLIVFLVVFGISMFWFTLYIIYLARSKLMRRRSNATKTVAKTAKIVEDVHVKLMNINPDTKFNGSKL